MNFFCFKKKEKAIVPVVPSTELDTSEVFCTLAPLESNGLSLEEQGFVKIPDTLLPQAAALLQYAPGEAVALSSLGTYKAVFDRGLGVLQKSAKFPGTVLGNVVSPGTNNNIKGVAVWQEVSATPQLALSIFTAASVVTGQYFMAQMNSKLSQINQGVRGLYEYMETEDFGVLKTTDEYLQGVYSNLRSISENDVQRQSTLTNVTDRKLKCSEIADKYAKLLEEMAMPSKSKDEISATFVSFSKRLSVYHYALQLYSGALYLEMILSQNTDADYLHGLIKDIQDRTGMYDFHLFKWEHRLDNYIDDAKGLRRERRKERRNPQNFKLEEGSPAWYKASISRLFYDHKNLDPVHALEQEIERVNCLYNKPVEAVISDGELYVRCAS